MCESTYGIVRSGGGIRGLAHVGVIKALEEEGIYPNYIAGASADDILAFFHKTSIKA